MENSRIHPILNSVLLLAILLIVIPKLWKENDSMGYVDNARLFNEFNMTKDIRTVEERKIKGMMKQLDSTYKTLQAVKDQKSDRAKQLIKEINQKQKDLEQAQLKFQNELTQSVWNRLNGYINDFSEERDMDIVFGANGNGNVMFAKKRVDITDQLLQFSNNKYEGVN